MNIKIKTFFLFIGTLILFITLSIGYFIFQLHENNLKLKDIEHNRYSMIKKADELRQSSDDLTRFARSYCITGDESYKENYYTILDIRNAKVPRPENYDYIYWDLSESVREKRHPFRKKTSINFEMKNLPYTAFEFEKLNSAEVNSNELVNLEIEAFHAMAGLYKNADDEYLDKGDVNQTLAVELLHSKEYHSAKEKIMLPIDEFLISLEGRTQKDILKCNNKIDDVFRNIFFLLGLGFFIFLITLIMITKKVLTPISRLSNVIVAFQKGEKEIGKIRHYNDEIGLMIKQFFIMKKKSDDDHEVIKKLSLLDPLTEIFNRRAFFELAGKLLNLSRRKKEPLSLLMLDIDFFKKINDSYGHIVGDELIKHIVGRIKTEVRDSDILARYGGEEFIVLLPNTDIDGAMGVAQKIRLSVEEHQYVHKKEKFNITISVGISGFREGDGIKELIHRSDEALYSAKKQGRNRVEVTH